MKEAGMRIRVEPELREAFITACRGQDMPAAQVLRGFMREYVRKCQRVQSKTTVAPKADKK
jgi:hypothetical protein